MSRVAPSVALAAAIPVVLVAAPAWAQDDDDPAPEPEATTRVRTDGPAAPFNQRWLEPFFGTGALRAAAEKYRLEDWDGAADSLSRALKSLPRSSPDRLPGRYLLALAQAGSGRYGEAARLFEDLHKSYPLLGPYHAYHAARCRLRAGDADAALEWVDRVPVGTVPKAEAELVKLDALRALGRWSELESAASTFLGRFPSGPRRAEASFRRAEALEALGRPASELGPLYRRIWAEAPLEIWADRAADRLEALARAATGPDAGVAGAAAASHWLTRGKAFFARNRNQESESAFAAALGAPGLDPDIECQARFHLAQSVWKQRQRPRAAPLFDQAEPVCRKAKNDDLRAKSLYQAARCHANSGDTETALARYAMVEADHAGHSYADDARLRAAELKAESGDDAGCVALLTELPERYPGGDQLGEALWRLALRSWQAGQHEEALRWLDENLRRIPREEIWYAEGRAHYWRGRSLEKLSRADEAREAYEKAVREYPLSVYALLSLQRLRASFPSARKALERELRSGFETNGRWKFAPSPLYGEPGFLRAVDLARMGLGSDARRELARLGISAGGKRNPASLPKGESEDMLWIAAILLDRGGVWSASHAIPRYTLSAYRLEYPRAVGASKWRLAYPRGFPELVRRNSKANRLAEALQLAIIREESAFNPRIESFANAIGLTQMLVKTARRFANGGAITRERLTDPARNLEVGSRFLAFQWKRYDGAAPLAIAAYNAGEGAVDRWLRERGDLEMDEFMETIPYDETRNYTKRVLASYFAYTWLYTPAKPVPEIPIRLQKGRPEPAARM